MYFNSRVEAGKLLAEKLEHYKKEKCAVVALSDGGVVVGAQIAARLHCVMTLLMAEPINAPGEPEEVASINQDGGYTYNSSYSPGQIEEFDMEYHQFFEQDKRDKLSAMHRLLGRHGIIRRDLVKRRVVILVADGLGKGFSLEAAKLYLKSIKVKKIVIAVPVANIGAVDKMHLLADELYCLSTVDNYMGADHYYEDNRMPSHETVIQTIQNLVDNWQAA